MPHRRTTAEDRPANGNDNDGTGAKKRGSITVSIYDNGSIPAEEGTAEENRWTRWLNENGPVDVKFVRRAARGIAGEVQLRCLQPEMRRI